MKNLLFSGLAICLTCPACSFLVGDYSVSEEPDGSALKDEIQNQDEGLSLNDFTNSEDGADVDPLNAGLVGYWKFDESEWICDCNTLSIKNQTSSELNGYACNSKNLYNDCPDGSGACPVLQPNGCQVSSCAEFTNQCAQIEIPDLNGKLALTKLSISFWVNLSETATNRGTHIGLVALIDNQEQSPYFSFHIIQNENNQICFEWTKQDKTSVEVCSTVEIYIPNYWHHIVAAKDNSSLLLYVDDMTPTRQTAPNEIYSFNSYLFRLNPYWDHWFRGRIDEVRIYNRALSAEEVNSLFLLYD